jgi:hypothetical protein
MPPEVSLTSIKGTNRRATELSVQRVEVQMWRELSGISSELIFSKSIGLTKENYDML